MIDIAIITVIVIVLIITVTTSFLICCLPQHFLNDEREYYTNILRNIYGNITLVGNRALPTPIIKKTFVETRACQTITIPCQTKQVRFEGLNFKDFKEVTEPLYTSLPILTLPNLYPAVPRKDLEEYSTEEEEAEPEKDKAPKLEHKTDDRDLEEEAAERQPLNTVQTVDIGQPVSHLHLQQTQELTNEVLITRIARLEKRLRQLDI